MYIHHYSDDIYLLVPGAVHVGDADSDVRADVQLLERVAGPPEHASGLPLLLLLRSASRAGRDGRPGQRWSRAALRGGVHHSTALLLALHFSGARHAPPAVTGPRHGHGGIGVSVKSALPHISNTNRPIYYIDRKPPGLILLNIYGDLKY